jgi:FkbM family methyltransferase
VVVDDLEGGMMRGSLRSVARIAAERAGIEVHRLGPTLAERRRIAVLAAAGVTVVVDGGANRGGYGAALRRGGYGGAILSLEPVSAQFERLRLVAQNDRAWECRRVALGARREMLTMNVSDGGGVTSSLLPVPEATPGAELAFVATEQVEVVTVDSLGLADDRIALKLDLEGFEPQALDGAADTFDRVWVVEIELSIRPSWKAEHRGDSRAMIDRLKAQGLTLVGVEPGTTDWSTGQVYEVDALLQRL